MQYKLYKLPDNSYAQAILRISDEGVISCVPDSPQNTDWQAYQAWLAADPENNIPEPADEE